MTHYFNDNSDLEKNRQEHTFSFYGNTYSFTTDNGVFSKRGVDEGTIILLNALMEETIIGNILDLGCGYGVISIVLKTLKDNTIFTAVDINPRAIELTKINAENCGANIKALVSDGLNEVSDTFDVIISNPPIRTGKAVIYKLFSDSCDHLVSGGVLYLVIRRKQGAESAIKKLNEIFEEVKVIKRSKGYWVIKAKKA